MILHDLPMAQEPRNKGTDSKKKDKHDAKDTKGANKVQLRTSSCVSMVWSQYQGHAKRADPTHPVRFSSECLEATSLAGKTQSSSPLSLSLKHFVSTRNKPFQEKNYLFLEAQNMPRVSVCVVEVAHIEHGEEREGD